MNDYCKERSKEEQARLDKLREEARKKVAGANAAKR